MIRVSEKLHRSFPDSHLILQVHDELIVECPEEDAEAVCRVLEEEMENAVSLAVKMKVEAHSGKTWLAAKE